MKKKELEEIINAEKTLYLSENIQTQKNMEKRLHKRFLIWRYLYYFRYWRFYREQRTNSNESRLTRKIAKYKGRYYEKKKNIYSYRSGVEIGGQCKIGKNCDIWHSGVVINGNVGDNCVFHGNNIIGNKGIGKASEIPNIGNNVDIGAGAVVIGNIYIACNCVIGANAVVTKSFEESGTIIAGVPGRNIN